MGTWGGGWFVARDFFSYFDLFWQEEVSVVIAAAVRVLVERRTYFVVDVLTVKGEIVIHTISSKTIGQLISQL